MCCLCTCYMFFFFPSVCISLATRTGMIIVRKLNLESGTPGFESFESAASDQPLDLHSPYLSLFPSLLFLLWRVSLLNSLNQLWNKRSSHCRGTSSSRKMYVCAFTHFNKCEQKQLTERQFLQPVWTCNYRFELNCLSFSTAYCVCMLYISVVPPLGCFTSFTFILCVCLYWYVTQHTAQCSILVFGIDTDFQFVEISVWMLFWFLLKWLAIFPSSWNIA